LLYDFNIEEKNFSACCSRGSPPGFAGPVAVAEIRGFADAKEEVDDVFAEDDDEDVDGKLSGIQSLSDPNSAVCCRLERPSAFLASTL